MTKTVNTALTVIIIFSMIALLFYGYCAIQQLDESKEVEVNSTIKKHINYKEKVAEDNGITTDTYLEEEESISEDENFEVYIEEEETIEEETIEEEESTIEEEYIVETTAPATTPFPVTETHPFLIIAGSYKNLNNARNKLKQYENIGLTAEIVQLSNSEFNSICIAKTKTELEANDTLSKLIQQHNIKAYVYKSPQKKY